MTVRTHNYFCLVAVILNWGLVCFSLLMFAQLVMMPLSVWDAKAVIAFVLSFAPTITLVALMTKPDSVESR